MEADWQEWWQAPFIWNHLWRWILCRMASQLKIKASVSDGILTYSMLNHKALPDNSAFSISSTWHKFAIVSFSLVTLFGRRSPTWHLLTQIKGPATAGRNRFMLNMGCQSLKSLVCQDEPFLARPFSLSALPDILHNPQHNCADLTDLSVQSESSCGVPQQALWHCSGPSDPTHQLDLAQCRVTWLVPICGATA